LRRWRRLYSAGDAPHGHADADANGDGKCNADGESNADANPDADANANANANANADSNANPDADSNPDAVIRRRNSQSDVAELPCDRGELRAEPRRLADELHRKL
jgi:hypothetical protein